MTDAIAANNPLSTIARIERALSGLRVPATPGEYDLHKMIADALTQHNVEFFHEVTLMPRCRIDFVVDGVGIEVKKGKVSPRMLKTQAARYLASEKLCALMLITTRGASLPGIMGGKPVKVFGLNRLWGVSLS